jgi:pyruvate kinase
LNGKIELAKGDKFILDAKWGENGELGNQERVGLDYKALPRDVRPDDQLLLNDGLIVLVVDAWSAARSTPPSRSAASCPTTRASTARAAA